MKLIIDYEKKTVQIEQAESIGALLNELSNIISDGKWDQWKIEHLNKDDEILKEINKDVKYLDPIRPAYPMHLYDPNQQPIYYATIPVCYCSSDTINTTSTKTEK